MSSQRWHLGNEGHRISRRLFTKNESALGTVCGKFTHVHKWHVWSFLLLVICDGKKKWLTSRLLSLGVFFETSSVSWSSMSMTWISAKKPSVSITSRGIGALLGTVWDVSARMYKLKQKFTYLAAVVVLNFRPPTDCTLSWLCWLCSGIVVLLSPSSSSSPSLDIWTRALFLPSMNQNQWVTMVKNWGTHGVFHSQNLIPQHQYPRQELPWLEAMMGLKLSKLEGLC